MFCASKSKQEESIIRGLTTEPVNRKIRSLSIIDMDAEKRAALIGFHARMMCHHFLEMEKKHHGK